MSCNSCTRSYGFFCKESGCPNCGFSFCTKCLKKEIEVPKYNNRKNKVCLKCFEILSKIKEQSDHLQAEDSKIKLADNKIFAITEPFAAPILEPIHPAEEVLADESDATKDVEIEQNLDIQITKRLASLKSDLPSLPTNDKDMAERLASLKGTEYKESKNIDILLSTDARTDQEKIQDLLQQFVEENNIDSAVSQSSTDPVLDIEKRLAALRGHDIDAVGKSNIPKDESTNVSKIVKRYLEEAKLPEIDADEKELTAGLPTASDNPDLEELPYCVICNEDATIRCSDCDNDLYCKNCFKEIHNDEEYRLHRTKSYSMPPKFKENHF